MTTISCDPQALIDSITRLIGAGSPCSNQLVDVVPLFWELAGDEACYDNYIRYLVAKREAILFLMGCEAYSVDEYAMNFQMDDKRIGDTVAKFTSQSQSTGNSTKFARGHGETRYDETNTARSRGDMVRHGRDTHQGDGVSDYRDDGRGTGFNNSRATNQIDAVTTSFDDKTTVARGQERGSRSDCNYEYSQNNSEGSGLTVVVASWSRTTSASDWRKYTRNRSSDEDQSISTSLHYGQTDTLDVRRGSGTHGWLSQFLADVQWSERDYDIKIGHDRSDTRRHAEAHSRGDGDGLSEEKIEGHNAAQGTLKITGESNTLRTHSRVNHRTVTSLANSQRFRNLRLIYDQLTDFIEHNKKQYRGTVQPRIGQLPCYCKGQCKCGASIPSCLSSSQSGLVALGREALTWL